jgi:serine/threonine protein phosphatase PrpC
MEDEYFVTDGGRFAAVFDGHGGGGVSSFLKGHLYDRVCRSLAVVMWEQDMLADEKYPSLTCQVAALRSGFQQVDSEILQNDELRYQGSTAVAVVLHESQDGHRTLLSANVGDSRAILSRHGKAVDLTKDHKPNDESEKARILSMGETIEWDQYAKLHRVRNLSLSRAIGDRYAKPVVSGEVEIKHFPILDDGDEFFLLASDGVWDVMSSQDVVSYVHNKIEKELRRGDLGSHNRENFKVVLRRNMANYVAKEALRRGSGDNVCVLMVWLNDLGKGRD